MQSLLSAFCLFCAKKNNTRLTGLQLIANVVVAHHTLEAAGGEVAALPVLDALHSWIVRVEPFVQVLRENLMSFYQMSIPDICRERRKRRTCKIFG